MIDKVSFTVRRSTRAERGHRSHLEHAQALVTALQELANRRLLLPARLVDGLERLDRTRHVARLDDAHERPPEALTRLEKGRVRRDLARPLRGTDRVARVEVVDEKGLDRLIREDDEDPLLLEHVELSHARRRDDLDGDLVLLAQVREVDAIVRTVRDPIAVVCVQAQVSGANQSSQEEWQAKLTKGSRAGQAVRPDKVTGAERQSLKDEAPLAQLVLPLLNLVEPLFPRRPGTRPQGELVASPAKMNERQCEALLVLVGTRRRLIRGYCRLGAAASHERLGPDDTTACARGIVNRGDHEKLERNGLSEP